MPGLPEMGMKAGLQEEKLSYRQTPRFSGGNVIKFKVAVCLTFFIYPFH